MRRIAIAILLLLTINLSGQIRKDYQDHLVVGVAIGWSGGVMGWTFDKPLLTGIAAGVVIGGGKELIYDKWLGQGTPEWEDFAFTVGGAIIGAAVVKLLHTDNKRWVYGNTRIEPISYRNYPMLNYNNTWNGTQRSNRTR